MIKCALPECGKETEKKTHNQIYCSSECCRIATNRRIMEKYYARQAQRRGEKRLCSDCGVTQLSRYNESTKCNACLLKDVSTSRQNVVSMLAAVSWQ